MPVASWTAPASPEQNDSSLVTSSFTTATLTDISPIQNLIPGGALISSTRIHLHASGSYIATTTASTLKWGFYLSPPGGLIGAATAAILAETNPLAAVAVSGIPWIMDYWGVVNEIAVGQNATTGKITGQGWCMTGTSLTAFAIQPLPATVAGRTVTQTATITGLNTQGNLVAQLGMTVATNTGLTSVTADEFTCQLVG
jgi:hypothetical protein